MAEEKIGRYRLIRELGSGGMGAVFLAHDPRFGRDVALKKLPSAMLEQPTLRERFEREAQTIANLEHPAIVPVYDFGEDEGQLFLVMRAMTGGTLEDRLRKGAMPAEEVSAILTRLAQALDKAHEKGIVHRDIKPANILFDDEGRPYLSDFGIVKVVTADTLTAEHAIIGTPRYMSPEQALAEGELDGRSDVYSLGAVIFEMLTGNAPYQATTPMRVVMKHVTEPVPSLGDARPDLPLALDGTLKMAMAKAPEDRFSTAGAFAQAFAGAAHTSTRHREDTILDGAAPNSGLATGAGRKLSARTGIALAAAGGLVLIGALIAGFIFSRPDPTSVAAVATSTATATSVFPTHTASSETPVLSPTTAPVTVSDVRPSQTPTLAPTETSSPPTPIITPSLAPADIRENPIDGAPLVFIPGGEFTMGLTAEQAAYLLSTCDECNSDHFEASQPDHIVRVDPFWIYQTEVTNGMYARCVTATICQPPANPTSNTHENYWTSQQFVNYPVVHVTWTAADSYCSWAGGRLPTAAEWEKAARGTDSRLFPWGNELPDRRRGNIGRLFEDAVAVGSFPDGASPYGVLDMAGNVWEWVYDWFDVDYYETSPVDNPQGPDASPSGQRSGRGGSWFWYDAFASAAYHDWWEPYRQANGVGFRCVLDAE